MCSYADLCVQHMFVEPRAILSISQVFMEGVERLICIALRIVYTVASISCFPSRIGQSPKWNGGVGQIVWVDIMSLRLLCSTEIQLVSKHLVLTRKITVSSKLFVRSHGCSFTHI